MLTVYVPRPPAPVPRAVTTVPGAMALTVMEPTVTPEMEHAVAQVALPLMVKEPGAGAHA